MLTVIVRVHPYLLRRGVTRFKKKNTEGYAEVNGWNKIQIGFGNVISNNLTTTQIEALLTKKCIEKY